MLFIAGGALLLIAGLIAGGALLFIAGGASSLIAGGALLLIAGGAFVLIACLVTSLIHCSAFWCVTSLSGLKGDTSNHKLKQEKVIFNHDHFKKG